MSLMEWDETMSVGVPELDDQHRSLIALVNEAYLAIRKHDEHLLASLVDRMREYAAMHFRFEEDCMEKHGYPDLDHHRRLHEAFNAQVDDFRRQLFDKTNFSQVFVFLSRWLTDHIMREDMKYREFLPRQEPEGKPAG